MSEYYNDKESKLEDILQSIKGIIDNHDVSENENQEISLKEKDKNYTNENDQEAVLELDKIAEYETYSSNSKDFLISDEIQKQTEHEFKKIKNSAINGTVKRDDIDFLENKIDQIMRPLVKDWLNNNLPRIVEKVISEEVRRIIPK